LGVDYQLAGGVYESNLVLNPDRRETFGKASGGLELQVDYKCPCSIYEAAFFRLGARERQPLREGKSPFKLRLNDYLALAINESAFTVEQNKKEV
jgi:hypothetical protein